MLCRVQVQKSSDHLLVLRVMLSGFALEEINAVFAQANRDLDLLFAKSKFGRGGEKVPDDFDFAMRKDSTGASPRYSAGLAEVAL